MRIARLMFGIHHQEPDDCNLGLKIGHRTKEKEAGRESRLGQPENRKKKNSYRIVPAASTPSPTNQSRKFQQKGEYVEVSPPFG